MSTNTGPQILVADLLAVLEGINASLDLAVQAERTDPHILRLLDSSGNTLGFIDFPLRRVIWQGRSEGPTSDDEAARQPTQAHPAPMGRAETDPRL